MSRHQQTAVLRQFIEQADAHPGRLLGVVLEAVVPFGVVEPDRKHGVTGKGQPFAA
ncbi:hypothetical protein D3C71_1997670 [compost metagenome]